MKKKFLSLVSTICLAQSVFAYDLHMQAACDNGPSLTIGATGDFLMHEPLQERAQRDGSFMPQWSKWLRYTQGVDIMYGNLETPTAPGLTREGRDLQGPVGPVRFDNLVYTSYALFNLHPQLLADIKKSGWDIVSTANNHALDRGPRGVEKTIDELNRAELPFAGTRKSDEKFEDVGYKIIEKNGITTAWIACTAIYNIADTQNLLLGCERNESLILDMIRRLKTQVDAVIVTPHWGQEMADVIPFQKEFAHKLVEAGALAVIGAHPHILQPMEKIITKDGRETIVAYSMGNFVGFHPDIKQKTSMILFINLVKMSGITRIRDVQYMPALIRNRTGNLNDVAVLPIDKNGQLIGEKLLPAEAGQHYGEAAIQRLFSLFPQENMVEYGSSLDFTRACR